MQAMLDIVFKPKNPRKLHTGQQNSSSEPRFGMTEALEVAGPCCVLHP